MSAALRTREKKLVNKLFFRAEISYQSICESGRKKTHDVFTASSSDGHSNHFCVPRHGKAFRIQFMSGRRMQLVAASRGFNSRLRRTRIVQQHACVFFVHTMPDRYQESKNRALQAFDHYANLNKRKRQK